MKAIKYSLVGLSVLGLISAFTIHRSLEHIKYSMQQDVAEWNTHLPQGIKISLDNTVNFSGAQGSYVLSQELDGKPLSIATINFKSNFNIFTLLIPNSQFAVNGDGIVHFENFEDEETKYHYESKSKEFLTFNGTMGKNGDLKLNFNLPAYNFGIINKEDNAYSIFFNIDSTTGTFSKTDKLFNITSSTNQFEMLDSPEHKDGISFSMINLDFSFDEEDKKVQTSLTSSFKEIKDLSDAKLFSISGFKASFNASETDTKFTHSIKMNVDSLSSFNNQDNSYELDYDISVPIEAKPFILSLLKTYQSMDMIERQENALNLYKSGFNLNVNKFKVKDAQGEGNINFHLNLNPQKDILELPKRVSFDGIIKGKGTIIDILINSLPFNTEEVIKETPEGKLFQFGFKDSNLSFENKPAPTIYNDALNKSLMGLDVLMVEAEEELKLEKQQIALGESDSEEPDDEINEIPGTEEDTQQPQKTLDKTSK